MAKEKGQEAANRARSGRPNRKSGKSTPTSRKLKALKDTVTDPQTYIDSFVDALVLGGGAEAAGAAGRGAQIVGSAARRGGIKNLGAYAEDALATRSIRKQISKDVAEDMWQAGLFDEAYNTFSPIKPGRTMKRWNAAKANYIEQEVKALSQIRARRPVVADRAEKIVQKEMSKISKNMAKRANHPSIRFK